MAHAMALTMTTASQGLVDMHGVTSHRCHNAVIFLISNGTKRFLLCNEIHTSLSYQVLNRHNKHFKAILSLILANEEFQKISGMINILDSVVKRALNCFSCWEPWNLVDNKMWKIRCNWPLCYYVKEKQTTLIMEFSWELS